MNEKVISGIFASHDLTYVASIFLKQTNVNIVNNIFFSTKKIVK